MYAFFLFAFLVPENVEERQKRQKIEAALTNRDTPLSKWQEFAKSEYGLVSGKNSLNFCILIIIYCFKLFC